METFRDSVRIKLVQQFLSDIISNGKLVSMGCDSMSVLTVITINLYVLEREITGSEIK